MFEPGNAEYSDLLFSCKREEEVFIMSHNKSCIAKLFIKCLPFFQKRYVCALEDCTAMERKQPELTDGMRRTLIDWLTEVVEVTYSYLFSSFCIAYLTMDA